MARTPYPMQLVRKRRSSIAWRRAYDRTLNERMAKGIKSTPEFERQENARKSLSNG